MNDNPSIYKLKRIYWSLRPEMKEWYRTFIFSIPGKTGEYFRRGYGRRYFKSCGDNLKMYPHVKIYNPQNLVVGDGVVIADHVQISAGGGVTIGNQVGIGPYVYIWSINHNFDRLDIPIYDQGWTTDPVVIEDDVWIGMNVIILPGVHIGKGSVISAGSLLGKKPIKPYSIVAGNPGRVIGFRNQAEDKQL